MDASKKDQFEHCFHLLRSVIIVTNLMEKFLWKTQKKYENYALLPWNVDYRPLGISAWFSIWNGKERGANVDKHEIIIIKCSESISKISK